MSARLQKIKATNRFSVREVWIAVFASRSHETPEHCENGVDFRLSAALACVAHVPAN